MVALTVAVIASGWAPPALAATTATVCLFDSTGVGIAGAAAEFRSGVWQPMGVTAVDGCVSTDSPAAAGKRDFRITYNGQTQQKTQDTLIDPVVTFSTIIVTGRLLDSTGAGIQGALIEYNAGGWKTLGTTDPTGQTSAQMLAANRTFRVTYNGQTQQKPQDTRIDPVVTFSTITVTGQLLDSNGVGIQGALVEYDANGWKTLGSTDVNGQTSAQLLPINEQFRVTHNGQTQAKTQNLGLDPIVTFSTIIVTGRLLDSNGVGIPGALVEYDAGGWKTLGTTDPTGQTSAQMLAANRRFRVTYNGQTAPKTQDTRIDPVVTFQTGRVLQGTGPRVLRYRATVWQTFFDGIELLPGSVRFDLDTGPDQTHTVVAGATIYVPTAPTPPAVTPGADLSIDEGGEILLDAGFTDLEPAQSHTATIDWGDGSALETGTVTQADGLSGTVAGSHVYADDGAYTIEICVTDNGNPDATGCGTLGVTVANVAPVVAISGSPGPVTIGTEVVLSAVGSDPGVNDLLAYLWSVTLTGEIVATGSVHTISFTPVLAGDHVFGLAVDDGDGGIGAAQLLITVTAAESQEQVAPVAQPEQPVTTTPVAPNTTPDPANEPAPDTSEQDQPAAAEPSPVEPEPSPVTHSSEGLTPLIHPSPDWAPSVMTVPVGSGQAGTDVLALDVSAEIADKYGVSNAGGSTDSPSTRLPAAIGVLAVAIAALISRRLLSDG